MDARYLEQVRLLLRWLPALPPFCPMPAKN